MIKETIKSDEREVCNMSKKIIIQSLLIVSLLMFSVTSVFAGSKVTIPIENTSTDNNEEFSFVMKKCSEECPDPKNSTIKIKGTGSSEFELDINKAGRFDYDVSEVKGNNSLMAYDDSKYRIIIVSTESEGRYQTSVILENGTEIKPDKVAFVNESKNSVSIIPLIEKRISDNKDYEDEFRFELKGEGVENVTSVKGEGTAAFPKLVFDKTGTYNYKVKEIKDNETDWNYDENEYDYRVTVKEENGRLVASANYKKMTFTNSPTLAKEIKRIVNVITNSDPKGESKSDKVKNDPKSDKNVKDPKIGKGPITGDTAKCLGIVALIALAVIFASGIKRKEKRTKEE